MSSPAVTITRDGPEPTPFAYTLGAKESFEPDSIAATFDGSGAAGSFLACCSFYSQDGSLIARCPASTTVAAGDIATVSFFPLAPSAQAASSGGAAYSRGYFNNTFSGDPVVPILGGGVGNRVPFAHVDADASGAITWTQTTNPNDTANLNTPGLYTVEGNARMNVAAAGQEILVKGVNTLAEQYSQLPWKSQYNGGVIDALGVATQETHALYRVTNTPVLISLFAMSNAAVNLGFAYLAIIYHGAV